MFATVYEFYGDYVIGGLFARKEDITPDDLVSQWKDYKYYVVFVPLEELPHIQRYLASC